MLILNKPKGLQLWLCISWERFGVISDYFSHLGPFGNHLGPFGSHLGHFRSHLRQFGNHLGVIWESIVTLGSCLGPSGNHLGPYGNHLGLFGKHLVTFGSQTSWFRYAEQISFRVSEWVSESVSESARLPDLELLLCETESELKIDQDYTWNLWFT